MNNHMKTAALYVRITDCHGSTKVEERQTWGENGPATLHASILKQYRKDYEDRIAKEKDKAKQLTIPRVEVITKAEYDAVRFSRRAA